MNNADVQYIARTKREKVLNEIKRNDITAAGIVKNTGIPTNEVHGIMSFLRRKGFVIKAGEVNSGVPGRKKVILWKWRKDMPERLLEPDTIKVSTNISRTDYDKLMEMVSGKRSSIAIELRQYIKNTLSHAH